MNPSQDKDTIQPMPEGVNAEPAKIPSVPTQPLPTGAAPSQNVPRSVETPAQDTPLASRIPMLRIYGLVLVFGSILFAIIDSNVFLGHKVIKGSVLLFIIGVYAILAVMCLCGVILLVSKSAAFVLKCLNAILGLAVILGILSLLSLNFVTLVLAFMMGTTLIRIKNLVKATV